MRPCAFMIFFCANLLQGRVVSFRGEKRIKDGGNLGKLLSLGSQSKAKLQFCGCHLAVEEL